MIEIADLTYGFRDAAQPLFKGFSWAVAAGEHWTILGPSGCGKTTLLKLLAGLRFPQAGALTIERKSLKRPRPETGLILQDYGLLPWSTVWHNVALGLKIRRFYGQDGIHTPKDGHVPGRRERRAIVDRWLRRLGLWEQRRQFPGQLSGGQRQRVAIARTLALEPDLLLMDEPFNSLDAAIREELQDLIIELRIELKMTTIIVTHAIDEAAVLGSRILFLQNPPHTRPTIIENPASEDPQYRTHAAYLEMRNHLRQLMGLPV
jgi:NitT/TauT family transport system ATP-binding protein